MAINPVSVKVEQNRNNTSTSKRVAFSNLNSNADNFESKTQKNNVSFGSLNALKDGATKAFKFIDNGGFFIEFLIVDTISLILPRIWIGLNRDKEELGHFNYKAGKEEAGREVLSGPSMNLIPMGILATVCAVQPASRMERSTLEGLTHNMIQVVDGATAQSVSGKGAELSKKLADKLFDEAFGTQFIGSKAEFSNLLVESTKHKQKSWISKMFGQNDPFTDAANKFAEKVAELNNRGAEAPIDPKALSIKTGTKPTSVNAANLFEDFHNYHRDVVDKLTKESITSSAADVLNKIKNNRLLLKTATAFTGFMTVGAFLLYLPKIYQQGKISPAEESAMRASKETQKEVQNENK